MQAIRFYKMHGLGNDFVVINTINQPFDLRKLNIATLADRHRGIGFDQLLLLGTSQIADFSCRIYNADGSEAEQCGNGMRCLGRFIHEQHLSDKPLIRLETRAGVIEITMTDYTAIQVNMGTPQFLALPQKEQLNIPNRQNGADDFLEFLSLGNPHLLLKVQSINSAPVTELGAKLSTHPLFPEGTNVGFIEVVNPEHIRLRTYERGAGETLACGSNACAAAVAGIKNHLLKDHVQVELPYGNLWVSWAGKAAPVMMTGPATFVFSGEISIKSP